MGTVDDTETAIRVCGEALGGAGVDKRNSGPLSKSNKDQ